MVEPGGVCCSSTLHLREFVADSTRSVYGPGTISFHLMLAKNFIVHEKWHTQFRWEAFNFTNTPAWGSGWKL